MTEDTTTQTDTPRYWKGLGELCQSQKFQQWSQREFPEGAVDAPERRDFLKLMGASFGLAGFGLTGCRYPEHKILPYSKQPEHIIPGVAMYYATSLPGAVEHLPLVVETHDGRPTKIEGNPSHEPTGGATSSYAQASILDLYDPDRLKASTSAGATLDLPQLRSELAGVVSKFKGNGGQGLALLLEPSTSPSRARLLEALKKTLPQALVATYAPIVQDGAERSAQGESGAATRPIYDFSKARRILALDSDFLATEPGHVAYARAFSAARDVETAKTTTCRSAARRGPRTQAR